MACDKGETQTRPCEDLVLRERMEEQGEGRSAILFRNIRIACYFKPTKYGGRQNGQSIKYIAIIILTFFMFSDILSLPISTGGKGKR